MDFYQLYESSVSMWPNKIDISDAKIMINGVLFKNLSSIWDEIEIESKKIDEWHDLMTWIIFGGLCKLGKQQYENKEKYVLTSQLVIQDLKNRFEDHLKVSGYEDMLEEYNLSNQ